LGYGWTHPYNLSLDVVQTSPTKRVCIWDSDGRALYFNKVQQSSDEILFSGESGVKDRFKQVISTGEYFLRRKEGHLTYKFGSNGKLFEISDPNGNSLTLTYTGNLLTQVSNNFGKTLSIQYNVNNRISSVTDPKGQSISYGYTNGDLTSVTYPDVNSTTYSYSNHRMTNKYDTNDNLIGHWEYDTYGRVITYYNHLKEGVPQERIDLTYQSGSTLVTRSAGAATYTTAVIGIRAIGVAPSKFGYSMEPGLKMIHLAIENGSTLVTYGKGRLTGRIDPSGSYTFYYDAQGNMTKEEKTINSVLYTTQYTFNKDNNLTSITYPTGRTVTYTLDVTGKTTQVSTALNDNPKTLASSITYLPYGGITGLTYGNTLSLTHGYDNQYQTSSIAVGSVMNRTYTYDPNGNVASIVNMDPLASDENAGLYT